MKIRISSPKAKRLGFSAKGPGIFDHLQLVKRFVDGTYPQSFSVVLIGVLAFVGSFAMGLVLGIATPQVHDEFSYLLAADTFAHGRVTNPTHSMWVHFETMHVIQQPSYMSKYMPAQGLFLALGRVLGGHPIVGVWLSMAFMCAAICWMLHAWVPPRWAVLGGVFAVIHPNLGVGGYWAQSYWGGAVAATGGALLIGGVRYLSRKPRIPYSLATGLGLAILAISRPYEGFVLSLPVGIGLLWWLGGKHGPNIGVTIRQVFLPLVVVGVITLAGMAFYNYRITGSQFRLPYLIHEQVYGVSPLFIWEKLPPVPAYRHDVIRDFHLKFALPLSLGKQSLKGFIKVNFTVLAMHVLVAGSVFIIPLVASPKQLLSWSLSSHWGHFALSVYLFFVFGIMIETYSFPHYWAPITALNYFFVLQGIRLWRARDRRVGQLVPVALLFLAVTVLAVNTYQSIAARDELAPALQRAKLLTQLTQSNDRHLILVNYGPNHSYVWEWVFNEADIDGSKVVWARDMELKENCQLIDYFKDRQVWSLDIDRDDVPVKLNPFPAQRCRF